MADGLDGKHVVFQRYDSASHDRDLYVKYVWDNRPDEQLTNTPGISETLPVISHDGSMLAYRAFHGAGVNDQIIVAQFTPGVGLTTLHTINPAMPVNTNISGIDFSPNATGGGIFPPRPTTSRSIPSTAARKCSTSTWTAPVKCA